MNLIFLLMLLVPAPCVGQNVTLEQDGHSAMGFNTDSGFLTVAHYSYSAGFADYDIDIKIDSIRAGKRFRVGVGVPAYFFDRRGTRHELSVLRRNAKEWQTDILFFSGESGLPVFNQRGRVVGVVKGNELAPLRSGLVARLGSLKIPRSVRERLSLPQARFRVAPSAQALSGVDAESSFGLRAVTDSPSLDETESPTSERTWFAIPSPVEPSQNADR